MVTSMPRDLGFPTQILTMEAGLCWERLFPEGLYFSWFRIFRAKEVPHRERGQLPRCWSNPPCCFAFLKKLILLFALSSSCLSAILFEAILPRMMATWLTLHSSPSAGQSFVKGKICFGITNYRVILTNELLLNNSCFYRIHIYVQFRFKLPWSSFYIILVTWEKYSFLLYITSQWLIYFITWNLNLLFTFILFPPRKVLFLIKTNELVLFFLFSILLGLLLWAIEGYVQISLLWTFHQKTKSTFLNCSTLFDYECSSNICFFCLLWWHHFYEIFCFLWLV